MKRSTILVAVLSTIVAIPLLLIMAVVGGYWWSNFGPFRPMSVGRSAVFLRAPATGGPGPPRGEWLECREGNRENHCKLSSKDGITEYEGVFVPYGHKGPIPADQLMIDAVKTRHEDRYAEWAGKAWVPLVYLKNGDVLIPADYYYKGTRILDQKRTKVE